VGGGTHAPLGGRSFIEPVTFWAPTSTAPSNVVIYNGSGFPEWNGSVLIGSLAGQRLWRVALNGTRLASCEPLLGALNQRIRDVRQGPDGWVWVLTDNGEIHRVIR
jgi:glucose/arabinose dehydrogenase